MAVGLARAIAGLEVKILPIPFLTGAAVINLLNFFKGSVSVNLDPMAAAVPPIAVSLKVGSFSFVPTSPSLSPPPPPISAAATGDTIVSDILFKKSEASTRRPFALNKGFKNLYMS
jgi:hypothetical protein